MSHIGLYSILMVLILWVIYRLWKFSVGFNCTRLMTSVQQTVDASKFPTLVGQFAQQPLCITQGSAFLGAVTQYFHIFTFKTPTTPFWGTYDGKPMANTYSNNFTMHRATILKFGKCLILPSTCGTHKFSAYGLQQGASSPKQGASSPLEKSWIENPKGERLYWWTPSTMCKSLEFRKLATVSYSGMINCKLF